MADAPIFCPTLHEQDQVTGTDLQTPQLQEQCSVVQGPRVVHSEIHRDGVRRQTRQRWCEEGDLRFLPPEGRAAEFEAARRHQGIGEGPDGGLLELASVEPTGGRAAPATAAGWVTAHTAVAEPILEPCREHIGGHADHNVNLWDGNAESSATTQSTAREGNDLHLRDGPPEGLLHHQREALDCPVALGGGGDALHELCDLSVPADGLEAGRGHRPRARLPQARRNRSGGDTGGGGGLVRPKAAIYR
mmetsp:Transcript_24979/g.83357  ORF Transcript_24979/g.83357 Transcript_24979/m.83357 type:complete len:247 (+) Transcript_24979:692-1432(+)